MSVLKRRKTSPICNSVSPLSLFDVFAWLGKAMMDFGFGSVVDKFEEYFGKKIAKILLILIGAAVASGSISLIFSFIINPVFEFAMFIFDTSPTAYEKYLTITKGVAGIVFLVMAGGAIVGVYQFRMIMRRLQDSFDKLGAGVDRQMTVLVLQSALTSVDGLLDEHYKKKPPIILKRWRLAQEFLEYQKIAKSEDFVRSDDSDITSEPLALQSPQDTETETPH